MNKSLVAPMKSFVTDRKVWHQNLVTVFCYASFRTIAPILCNLKWPSPQHSAHLE